MRVQDSRCPNLRTDAYDNLAKATRIEGHYFTMHAEKDHMMPPEYATDLCRSHLTAVQAGCADKEALAGRSVRELKRRLIKLRIDWRAAHCTEKPELLELLHTEGQKADLDKVCRTHTLVIRRGQHGQFFGDDVLAVGGYLRHLERIGL